MSRGGRDHYTLRPVAQFPTRPVVDHVVETQVCDNAIVRALDGFGPITRSRSLETQMALRIIHDANNMDANLNVTTQPVNNAKAGVFRRALRLANAREPASLRRLMLASPKTRWLADARDDDGDGDDVDVWTGIETTVVRAYDDMHDHLVGAGALGATPNARRVVVAFADALTGYMERFGALA